MAATARIGTRTTRADSRAEPGRFGPIFFQRYTDAKKLHNEGDPAAKSVTLLCDDGNSYHHTDVR